MAYDNLIEKWQNFIHISHGGVKIDFWLKLSRSKDYWKKKTNQLQKSAL